MRLDFIIGSNPFWIAKKCAGVVVIGSFIGELSSNSERTRPSDLIARTANERLPRYYMTDEKVIVESWGRPLYK